MAIALIVAGLCVLANGFFVAAEFALVKVRVTQLKTRARRGEPRAASALAATRQLDAYLSATQLGITLASLALGWLGEPALARLIAPVMRWMGLESEAVLHGVALTVAFVVITILHIVVGELAPKSLAIQRAESVALWVATPMRMFYTVTYPFLLVLNLLSNLVLRLMRVAPMRDPEGAMSAEEIGLVVAASKITLQKRELMERVLQGTDRPVSAIMVPRVDMQTVSTDDSPAQVLEGARTHGYSRVPVVQGQDPDRVVGYLYLKDLVLGDGMPAGGIAALRRDILFVPESRKTGDILQDFQRTRIPIAIVVDEYGGTSGLVTMEDVLEEIVGDLQDELDLEQPRIQEREQGIIVVDGLVAVSELSAHGIDIEPLEGHHVLAGHVVAKLGRLARPGDVVRLGAYDATVEDVRGRRVTRVRLVPAPPERRPSSRVPPPGVDEAGNESASWAQHGEPRD